MKCVSTALVLLVLANLANSKPTLEDQWKEFKTTHKKQYSGASEDLKRFEIFTDNVAKIEEHNVKYKSGKVTFSQKMNKFGDLTADEFLAFVSSTSGEQPVVPQELVKEYVRSKVPLAADVDWRTEGVLTPIADELECNASWAFSALGALESQLAIKNGRLTALSAQNLIDCSSGNGNAGCDGGSQNNAFDYIRSNGIVSAADYPYTGTAGSCRYDSSQSVTSVSGYTVIETMDEQALADAVANVGPVTASIHATYYFQFYYGGVLFDDTCNYSEGDLNHAVLIVGYGTQLQYDYWIVKNSWGTDWGENGYYKSIRNYANNCGIATRTSYPEI